MNDIKLVPGEYPLTRHNGEAYTLKIEQNVRHDGHLWSWKVDSQFFSKDEYAEGYLEKRVSELKTGKRYISNVKRGFPVICGFGGLSCRLRYRDDGTPAYSMLCSECPKAEQMQAERDGLTLVYMDE